MVKCFLVLEDGTIMEGTGFGSCGTTHGEVVFNTGMTGYQESLTDPSYMGQILVMSYPLIGNYGTNGVDFQSDDVQVRGFVVRERCDRPADIYGGDTIHEFLCDRGIPGISGVDTRELIIKIREHGTLRGAICSEDPEGMLESVRSMPYPSTGNLVGIASTDRVLHFPREGRRVALIDCGVKSGIVDQLRARFDLYQVPHDTPADWFMENRIDGVMISNGPGDPEHPDLKGTTVRTIDDLVSRIPVMGICMGNQLLSLAFGGSCYKMRFGHRGANQPVKHRGRVFITSQNHGYAVDGDSLDGSGLVADQFNLNDGTVEGVRHRDLPVLSVQYHPEALPGPMDTSFLWKEFEDLMGGSV